MRKTTVLAVSMALAMAGCANGPQTEQQTSGALLGGAVGCVGGVLLAKLTGENAAVACAAGAVLGGLVGFEQARQKEIAEAEKARAEAIEAMANLPKRQQARPGAIKTVEVTATDKAKGTSQKVKAFESVTVELPISTKGTPEYTAAMGKLKTLAERVADERGSAEIIVAVTPADARSQKVNMSGGRATTGKGNVITVTKVTDSKATAGMERITVKAGQLKTTQV